MYPDTTVQIYPSEDPSHVSQHPRGKHHRLAEVDDDDNEGYQFHEEYPSSSWDANAEELEHDYDPSLLGPQSHGPTTSAQTVYHPSNSTPNTIFPIW